MAPLAPQTQPFRLPGTNFSTPKFATALEGNKFVFKDGTTGSKTDFSKYTPPVKESFDWTKFQFDTKNAPKVTGAMTGGGVTTEMIEPLPTPEEPQIASIEGRKNVPKTSMMDSMIPKASAMESDEILQGINSGKYDDTINQLSQEGYSIEEITQALQDELATAPSEVQTKAPDEEGMLDSLKFKSSEEFGMVEGAKDVLKFFANVPADSAQVVSGIWDAVKSPIETTTGIVKTAKGLSDKAVYATLNGIARQFGSKDVPPTVEAEMIDQMAAGIKEKYGTLGKFKKAIVENPADTLITFMPILGGVSKATRAAGFAETANKIDKLQSVINPVNVLKQEAKLIAKPIKGVTKLAGEVLGKTTGTSGETIRKAVELGGTPEFKSALRGKTTPQDILASTKEGLQAIKDNRSKLYGEDYVKLQANKTPIKIDDIVKNFAKILKDDYKIKMGDKGLDFSQSKITGGTSQSQIQSIFDDIQNWKDKTPEGLDVLKQRLQDYYRGTPDSSKGDRLSTIASNAVKDKIVQAVPEYAQMTGKFEKLTNDIRDITKTLSLNDKAQAQTAITKLNGVLRDNFPARQDMIKIIEEYTGKNIQGQIAGASLNAPLARGLAGVISAGGIMTGQLANPSFWAGLAVASPRLIGEMASIIGTTTDKITQAINNIKKYVPTRTNIPVNTMEGISKTPLKPNFTSNK